MNKKKKCEFCPQLISSQSDSTICKQCDAELERTQEIDLNALKHQHSTKYKCQHCGSGLPMNRARHCETCLPDDWRATDDTPSTHFFNPTPRVRGPESVARRKYA